MGKIIDLTGQKFGRWTVLYKSEKRTSDNQIMWHCKCDCGNEKDVPRKLLRNRHSQSCGCLRKEVASYNHTKNLIGQKFGRLIVIERIGSTEQKKATWKCKCECGNEIIVPTGSLTSGNTTSCGCYNKEAVAERSKNNLLKQVFGKLTVLEETSNRKNGDIVWKCQCECGNLCYIPTSYLTSGHTKSCGCLNSSYGELKITNLLQSNNIPFQKEYSFNNLKFEDTNYFARFDFYVNNKYLIEFDGEQHFNFKNNWHDTLQDFVKRQEHDRIKNQYCKEYNIPLIRIPYTHLNDLCLEDLLLETSQFIVT